MDIPVDVNIQISGSYEEQMDSFTDLAVLALMIIILVFIVMAAQFESLTLPFIIMFSIPFAFSGVIMMLFFTKTTLNIMSLLGGIMLIGIVVKNGIVLIDYITLCRERGKAILNSVVVAGRSRLRPVLMTTLTTILGMIPMAVGTGQGSEMWRPMGIAVIGGLSISTVLTLILVPVLYCVFSGIGVKRKRRSNRKKREMQAYFDTHKQYIIKHK
jgi:HAE1 family hydrophobic/amphiphilic exporter-1